MFRTKKEQKETSENINDVKHRYELKIKELKKEHELELRDKEFELKHFKDGELKKLEKEKNELEKKNSVLKKENQMLEKITDLNSDIIDIKNLVEKLIEKLPEINLQNLTVKNEK